MPAAPFFNSLLGCDGFDCMVWCPVGVQVHEVMEVMEALAARVWVHAGARLEGAVRVVEAGVVKVCAAGHGMPRALGGGRPGAGGVLGR